MDDRIGASLSQLEERMAALKQEYIARQEVMATILEQQVAFNQSLDRTGEEMDRLTQGVNAVCQQVYGLRDDVLRRYIFHIPFLHLK